MSYLQQIDPEIAEAIKGEENRQRGAWNSSHPKILSAGRYGKLKGPF